MQPTANFNPSRLAKSLLRRSRQGALATLMAGKRRSLLFTGERCERPRWRPDSADFAAGRSHQKHPRRRPRLADAGRARAGRSARGRADHGGGPRRGGGRRRARSCCAGAISTRIRPRRPLSISRISPSSASSPSGAHLVAGFGRIVDLKPEQFLTEIGDAAALIEAEQGAVEHMNEDHREAMNLYATKLLGAESADWRCTGCDPEGLDMQAGAADAAARISGARHQPPASCARCWSSLRKRRGRRPETARLR